jgi:hypothetical protein
MGLSMLAKSDRLLARELVRLGQIDSDLMDRLTTSLQSQSEPYSLIEYLKRLTVDGQITAVQIQSAEYLVEALRFAADDLAKTAEPQPHSVEIPALAKTAEPQPHSVEIPALPETPEPTKNIAETSKNEAAADAGERSSSSGRHRTKSGSGSGVIKKRRTKRSSTRIQKKGGSGVRRGVQKKRDKDGSRRLKNSKVSVSGSGIHRKLAPKPAAESTQTTARSETPIEKKKRGSSATLKRVSKLPKDSEEGISTPVIAGLIGCLILLLFIILSLPTSSIEAEDPAWLKDSPRKKKSFAAVEEELYQQRSGSKKKLMRVSPKLAKKETESNRAGPVQMIRDRAANEDFAGALALLSKQARTAQSESLREEIESLRAQAFQTRIEIAEAQARRGEFREARKNLERCRSMGVRDSNEVINTKLAELELLAEESDKARPVEELLKRGLLDEAWAVVHGNTAKSGPMFQVSCKVKERLWQRGMIKVWQLADRNEFNPAIAALGELKDRDPPLPEDQFQSHLATLRRRQDALAGTNNPIEADRNKARDAGVSKTSANADNYKVDFHHLQIRCTKEFSGSPSSLLDELVAVMKRSEQLVKHSPEMAYDVCSFYFPRRTFLKKDPVLAAELQQHVENAFHAILSTVTGPAGFHRLAQFCDRFGYVEGRKELAPILARLAASTASGRSRSQAALRRRQAGIKREIQAFERRSKLKVIGELQDLLGWVGNQGLRSPKSDGRLNELIDRLCGQLNDDSELNSRFLDALQQVSAKKREESVTTEMLKEFEGRCQSLINKIEDRMLKAVNKALTAKEPAVAYDLLRKALMVKPGSDRVYRGLLYKKVKGTWIRPWAAAKRASGLSYDEQIGWHKGLVQKGRFYDLVGAAWRDLGPAEKTHSNPKSPWVIESEHFTLKSSASLAESLTVSRRLEAFYLQVFRLLDRFFSPGGSPQKVFALTRGTRHQVTFYKDRKQYLDFAKPPAKWSAGFWDGGRRSSFFYSTGGNWTVLQHEIVHQILGESSAGHAEAWLAEGIAVYLENANFNESGQLTLGTLDQHRRPCSYHQQAQSGTPSISYKQVLELQTMALWSSGAIRDHYMGAGALVYFFMHFDGGCYRGSFLDFLKAGYHGAGAGALGATMGLTETALEWLFNRFYKLGFSDFRGETVTWGERAPYDLDYIARHYPNP